VKKSKINWRNIDYNNPLQVLYNPYRRTILDLLLFRDKKQPPSLTDIKEHLEVDHRTVRHHIRILEKAGYIETFQDENIQGKPKRVKITKVGEKAWDKIRVYIHGTKSFT
jgi:DNA-binding MarR family transcriptional regulator